MTDTEGIPSGSGEEGFDDESPAPASQTTAADAAPASKEPAEVNKDGSAKDKEAAAAGSEETKGIQRAALTEDDIREFREIFSLVDTDGSGAISTEELGVLVESVGMKLTPNELQDMVNELDADQSGEIESARWRSPLET